MTKIREDTRHDEEEEKREKREEEEDDYYIFDLMIIDLFYFWWIELTHIYWHSIDKMQFVIAFAKYNNNQFTSIFLYW